MSFPLLVADDSPIALLVLTRRLADAGVPCCQAQSAAEASTVDARGLRGAILDLDLGDGSGVDVAEALRARVGDLPIAFFSAGAPVAVLARAGELGTVFAKPDELEQVVAWAIALLTAA